MSARFLAFAAVALFLVLVGIGLSNGEPPTMEQDDCNQARAVAAQFGANDNLGPCR